MAVRATGLNFKDVLSAMKLYPGDPGPLGGECAGVVARVGEGVTDFKKGDPVMGVAPGAFRSHVRMDVRLAAHKPATLSFDAAATFPIPFITAAFALEHLGGLRRGDRVLIHAAAGGVGLAAVQLAHAAGAEIFATAGSDEKRAHLTSLGVRHVFDSRTVGFADEIRSRTAGAGVDVVLNSLSGAAIESSLSVLARNGRFLEIGKRGILDPADMSRRRPDAAYHVIDWGETSRQEPELVSRLYRSLLERLGNGTLAALPVRTFDVTRITEAFRFMAQARHIGKIAVLHEAPASGSAVRADGSYLVTGGLAGLGLLSAEWLADRGASHLLLLGRRAPSPEAQATLDRLSARGVRVLVSQTDIGDREALRQALRAAADWPPLRGVIHSAGVLDDGVLTQQDWGRFGRVMRPKVDGSWNLHVETLDRPLDFFLMYSSIASVFGSAGQSNHAAANAFLDALAHLRRSCGLPAISINWGGWAEIGSVIRQNVGARIASQGLGVLKPETGLRALTRLLSGAPAQTSAVAVAWPDWLARPAAATPFFDRLRDRTRRVAAQASARRAQPATVDLKARLDAAPVDTRPALLTVYVREQAQKVLGLAADRAIDPRVPLHDFGLDSLMAVELRNALSVGASRALPATLLFDHPTIDALAAYLGAEFGLQVAEASTTGEEVLGTIEDLSDEEVDRLLNARMKAIS